MSDSEVRAVLADLEQHMGKLRATVAALQEVLADETPEVPGDHATA